MTKRNTREEILDQALCLFSERGYDGVSVRDISGAVGIRESALYKHFSGKQDIFDSLVARMTKRYEEAARSFHLPQGELSSVAEQYTRNDVDTMKQLTKSVFLFWLKDESAAAFRRMLTIEQFKNTLAGETYRSFMIEGVLDFQSKVFAEMIRKGFFRPGDPQAMALQFYGPLFLLLSRYDGQPEREEEALRLVDAHMEGFTAQFRSENF